MNKDLSAAEAARILGVSLATLYSYVSRGLLSPGSSGPARRKRYPHEDVLRLAARNSDARRGGQAAVAAMHWGLPVLETHISQINAGQLLYRGCEATALAGHATLEATACLLWDAGADDYFAQDAAALPPGLLERALACVPGAPPLQRAMAVMPALAHCVAPHTDTAGAMARQGPVLMRLLAAILLGAAPSALPLHQQLARAWGADAAQGELIRAALVLLADHELNASTFAVRCVASTGASLPAALGAGLAALSGARHGGGSGAAMRMLAGALATPRPAAFIDAYYRSVAAELAGYGHPLYAQGDPRAAYLLARLDGMAQHTPRLAAILSTCAAAADALAARPNADLALAAMTLAFGWPDTAAISIFALARCAGWIAHAAEQAGDAAMIRPRARYVGRYRRD